MIISNEKKFIYLRVPKTGSTSVAVYMYENLPLERSILRTADRLEYLDVSNYNIRPGYFDVQSLQLPQNTHSTIQHAITAGLLKYDISEYDVYGVLRNPVDRFISFWSMTKAIEGFDIVSSYDVFKEFMKGFANKSQLNWLKYNGKLINKLFLYEDIGNLITDISAKYNVTDTEAFNKYKFRSYEKQTHIPERVLNYIKFVWEEDFELYANLKNSKPTV